MSIKKYSDYIALHEQKTKTIGLRSSIEEPAKKDSVHVLDDEGERHVHVTGAGSVKELDKAIAHHLKTQHNFSNEDVDGYYHEAYYDISPFHHDKPGKKSTPDEVRTKEEHVKEIAGRVVQMKKDNEEAYERDREREEREERERK